jgi:hypothetical protein
MAPSVAQWTPIGIHLHVEGQPQRFVAGSASGSMLTTAMSSGIRPCQELNLGGVVYVRLLPYRLARPVRLLLLLHAVAMMVALHGRHNIGLVAAAGGLSIGKIRLGVAAHNRPHLSLCCSLQSEIKSKPNMLMPRVNAFDHDSEGVAAVGAHTPGRRNSEGGSISTAAPQQSGSTNNNRHSNNSTMHNRLVWRCSWAPHRIWSRVLRYLGSPPHRPSCSPICV